MQPDQEAKPARKKRLLQQKKLIASKGNDLVMLSNSHQSIVKSLFLASLALLLLIFPQSEYLFSLAVVLSSLVGLRELYRLVAHPKLIRFSCVLAVSILLGYGLGSFIYLLSNATFSASDHQYWSRQGLWFDQLGLSIAFAACLLGSAILYMWAVFETPVYRSISAYARMDTKSDRLVWLGVVLTVVALLAGSIGYMGSTADELGNISEIGSIVALIVPALVPYTILLITCEPRRTKKIILLLAVLFLLGVLLLLGRRHLLYTLVLSAIALRIRGYKFTKNRAIWTVSLAAACLAILYYGFSFFLALRFSINTLEQDLGLLSQISLAFAQFSGTDTQFLRTTLAENLGTRPFILSYMAGLIGSNNNWVPSYGMEIIYSIKMAIPSLLMPGKAEALPSSSEELMHPLYGIPIFDGPGSYLVSGLNDFGFLGAIFYPLSVVLILSWSYKILNSLIRNQAILLLISFVFLFQLFYIEQSLSAVFVALRNLAIIVIVVWALQRFPYFYIMLSPKR